MHGVVLASMATVMLAAYLVKLGVLPALAKFLPELFSAIVAIYVIVAGVGQRFRFVPSKYWVMFGVLGLWLVCGILANGVGTGPIVAGIRTYLRPLPFFLLPAVVNFQDLQIRQQLKLLLGLALGRSEPEHRRWYERR